MSRDAIAPPEPKEIDETRSVKLRHLTANAGLRGGLSGDDLAKIGWPSGRAPLRCRLGEVSYQPNMAAAVTHPQIL
jgi:hypothetical protein